MTTGTSEYQFAFIWPQRSRFAQSCAWTDVRQCALGPTRSTALSSEMRCSAHRAHRQRSAQSIAPRGVRLSSSELAAATQAPWPLGVTLGQDKVLVGVCLPPAGSMLPLP